jgi:transcriptional regulator with XRE-family HTH domain
MPVSLATQFGTLLREFRERAGLSQSDLAFFLNVNASIIKDWEAGDKEPPRNWEFYERCRGVPEFTEADIARLWITSFSNTEWDYKPPEEPQAFRTDVLTQGISEIQSSYPQIGLEEKAQKPHLRSKSIDAERYGIISLLTTLIKVKSGEHLTKHISELQWQAKLGSETKQQPIHYPHENVVFHVAQLRADALSQPDRLMTLRQAANLYPDDVSYRDVLRWHNSGRLKELGRRWLARPGGRSIPLVSQAEVAYLKDNPPPVGKHIREEKAKSKRGVAFERRRAQQTQEQQGAEPPEHLITLAEASKVSGITLGTLYNYLHEGKLTERGREPYPAPGRGKVLVEPDEVRLLPRRPRGRPKKNPR